MEMNRLLVFSALIMLIVLLPLSQTTSIAENVVNNIKLSIYYDPVSDTGLVIEELTLSSQASSGGVIIDLPLINASQVEVINVTDTSNNQILYDYHSDTNTITVYANNTASIKIYYTINGFMDEVAPGTYSGILDLSAYQGISLTAMIEVEGVYEAIVVPSGNYAVSGNTTIIQLNQPDTYTITLITSITTPPTPTITPTQPGATTTTTTTPGAAGTTSSPAGGGAAATTAGGTKTTTGGAGGLGANTIIAIIIIAVIIIGVVAAIALRK